MLSIAVAALSFGLSVVALVTYFVYTTFGDLFMCLAAVTQLWIWKFVLLGARNSTAVGTRTRSVSNGDIEMQPMMAREDDD